METGVCLCTQCPNSVMHGQVLAKGTDSQSYGRDIEMPFTPHLPNTAGFAFQFFSCILSCLVWWAALEALLSPLGHLGAWPSKLGHAIHLTSRRHGLVFDSLSCPVTSLILLFFPSLSPDHIWELKCLRHFPVPLTSSACWHARALTVSRAVGSESQDPG